MVDYLQLPTMKYSIFIYLFLAFSLICNSYASEENLEEVNQDELLKLVKDEKYVLILFMKEQQCKDKCQDYENHLLSIREDLVEAVGAWVIKSHAPSILTSWGGDATNTVVFVRHGVPMLFTGSVQQEEEMLEYLLFNKDSNVVQLTDDNFEHQTQASSGATTGDWLVVFNKEDCEACDRVISHVQAAGANLKSRKNVALMGREDGGGVTTRRLGITEFPTAILFRLGRMYRIPHSSMKAGDLTAFAADGFRNSKAENIPKPKTPFDDVTQATADWLRENPYQFLAGVGGVFLIILVLVLLNSPPPQSWTQPAKKKKKQ